MPIALAVPGLGEWWPLLLVGLLLFGGKRLPDVARGLGRSLRIFKAEVKAMDEPPTDDDTDKSSDKN
mgnify:CR=1 FL=1